MKGTHKGNKKVRLETDIEQAQRALKKSNLKPNLPGGRGQMEAILIKRQESHKYLTGNYYSDSSQEQIQSSQQNSNLDQARYSAGYQRNQLQT